jgi:hypothetical protein
MGRNNQTGPIPRQQLPWLTDADSESKHAILETAARVKQNRTLSLAISTQLTPVSGEDRSTPFAGALAILLVEWKLRHSPESASFPNEMSA